MCGFVGYSATPRAAPLFAAALPSAIDALMHRGPDDAGCWIAADQQVGLAHRRLSIVDLSAAGHQPMRLHRHGLTLVLNGEIYNHPDLRERCLRSGYTDWRGHSDTEVLLVHLAVFGVQETLKCLQGMFAFALHDARAGTLLLARDRLGEKPLFYGCDGRNLWFASELKALMRLPMQPMRLRPDALGAYLASGYVPGDSCILEGAAKLPPGHVLTLKCHSGQLTCTSYWQLPASAPAAAQTLSRVALTDQLEHLLSAAVARQLEADVPVAVLLSGGVDSSLMTALAARHRRDVNTFTISFPGHPEDEASHARLIADHFGTHHQSLPALPSSAELMPALAHHFDEPMADSSMLPTWLLCHQVGQSFKVAIGGDGGDELFGGYLHYSRYLRLADCGKRIPLLLRRLLASAAAQLPLGTRGRSLALDLGTNFRSELPGQCRLFRPREVAWLLGQAPPLQPSLSIFDSDCEMQDDLLLRLCRHDALNYLPEDILVKVDRCSMAAGLEMRAPFLDHHLVEFAFRDVPSIYKASDAGRKLLLKDLAARLLPQGFDQRRKQGFSVPLAAWLQQGPFRDLVHGVLLSSRCMFERRAVKRLLKLQDQGHSNSERLFALTLFELWRQRYSIPSL